MASSNTRLRRRVRVAPTLAAVAAALALGGCSVRMPQPYTPPLQQGNVIDQDTLAKLKPGMTRSQVRFLLGTPLVVDVFRNDRWDYVYFLRRQGQAPQQRRVTVIFDGDLLARIEGDVVPGPGMPQPGPTARTEPAPKAPPAKSEPAKPDPVKSDAAKPDAPRATLVKPEAAKAEAGKDEAAPQRGFFGRMLERIGL